MLQTAWREFLHTSGNIWKNPHKDPSAIAAFQTRKLRSVIAQAYQNVEYVRLLFNRCGIKPEDIRDQRDLAAVPLTSSQDYRLQPLKKTLSRKVSLRRTVSRATSGSSGRPFIIRRTSIEDHLLNLFRIRALREFGVRLKDKIAHIRLVSKSHQRQSYSGTIRQALGVYREYPIDSLQPVGQTLAQLASLKPDIIKAYPAVLSYIGSQACREDLAQLDCRFLIAGGESLPPFRKHLIEGNFGKKVYDIYGAHEFNLLAWKCPSSDYYHVCDDNVILEVLRDGRPAEVGERGEVVVTGLHSYSMPFIRYRLGDIATRGPAVCGCGQPFSTLRGIQGRMHDYFVMPGGRLMHPDKIIVPIMESESAWFDRYRLQQIREDLLVFQIQPLQTPRQGQLNRVKKLAKNILPADVEFRVSIVNNLLLESGGKFRFCRSMINSDCDDINWQGF